jgi:hypothetical protein
LHGGILEMKDRKIDEMELVSELKEVNGQKAKGARRKAQRTRRKAQGARHKAQGTRHKAQGTRRKAQRTTRKNSLQDAKRHQQR